MPHDIKIVISGPSGAGKTTIIERLLQKYSDFTLSTSYTTRSIREGEKNGQEYEFVTVDKFHQLEKTGFFIETECIFNNFYGTPKAQNNQRTIFNLGLQGSLRIKDIYHDATSVFILPPSIDELRNRLSNRNTDGLTRLDTLDEQISYYKFFDFLMINDSLDRIVKLFDKILDLKKEEKNALTIIQNISNNINR